MYDLFLGGKDNYAADRNAVDKVLQVFPHAPEMARTNRAFMRRVTRWLADRGIRQFLDIGTGIPTEPNLHQIAQEIAPASRVVYVDNDPIVLTHARALMTGTSEGRTAYIDADAADPAAILRAPDLRDTFDLTEPIGVSLLALLHFIPDDRAPYQIVSTLMDAVAPGSYLVMSHATADFDPESIAKAVRVYQQNGLTPQVRSHREFARFFDGLDMIEPGIVPPHRWHPDSIEPAAGKDARVSFYAAVGRKYPHPSNSGG
jgi:hypothetical protein